LERAVLKKYPMSPVSSKADNEIMFLMDVLIFSSTLDNSPTYEPQGQRIMVAEVRKGFEELIKAYPQSQYMQLVKKYYEMAKANGFRYSEERDRDFRKYLR
jgi:outer membrane protein assembly factor BamD (BamD/ComL family)